MLTRISLRILLVLALLAVPSTAFAQRDAFFSAVVTFYRSLAGLYGDEGAQLTSQLAAMSAALDRWDRELREAEGQWRSRLQSTDDVPTRLQMHTQLAALYLERGRLAEALREFDEDIGLDPGRAAFHRLKGIVQQAMSRPIEAADAFRAAWLLDPADPLNAYRLIAQRSAQTTAAELENALSTLALLEHGLVRRERPGAPAPFPNLGGIVDDAGGAIAFVPAAYASGFAFILEGELDRGVAALRAALAADPLVTDGAARSEPMARGISVLRQAASARAAPEGAVATAIEHLEAAVARARDSSEARRILASAYSITGDIARSVEHLRDGLRLNPRDERSWLALARTLDEAGRSAEAGDVLRSAVAAVPDAAVIRWRLATTLEKLQQADDSDRDLLTRAGRFVLLVGKGEIYRALARLAELHLDYEQTIGLLQQAALATPNNVAAHRALGHALVENGRGDEGYAELVMALLLDPNAADTLTELGRAHLAADRPAPAVEALDRAVALDPANRVAVHALAEALIRAGRTAEGKERLQAAERLLARALDDDRRSRSAAAFRLGADVRSRQGDHAGAIDLWRQAISLQPGAAAVHLRLAEALAAAGRHDEAVTEYRAAIALKAGADVHRRLADLYDALGRPDDAGRERAAHVERRLEELRQRAEQGAYGS